MTCPTCHPEASENQHDNLYLGLGDFFFVVIITMIVIS